MTEILRCKPGDMAIIIRDIRPDLINLGAIITCGGLCIDSKGGALSWTFTTKGRAIYSIYPGIEANCFPDNHLQPLPPKVEDIVTEDSLVIA